jgi:DNA-binding NarL/FixJ family response regulator
MVVVPEHRRRALLVHAVEDTLERVQIFKTRSLGEAEGQLLAAKASISVIMISSDFGVKEVARFIESSRKLQAGRSATFVLLFSEDLASDTLAKYLLVGINSFLLEPYSGESISEALSLGSIVFDGGSVPRMRAATGLMLREIIQEVCDSPSEDSKYRKVDAMWNDVKSVCEEFKLVTGESMTTAVVTALENIPPTQRMLRCEQLVSGLLKMLSGARKSSLSA